MELKFNHPWRPQKFSLIYLKFLSLQVGYKSSLRASQSISDLSHANADARTRLLRGIAGGELSKIIFYDLNKFLSSFLCFPLKILSYFFRISLTL
jgi:hypothetical protein